MDGSPLNRILWHCRRELGRLGGVGLAGFGLLALAAGTHVTAVEPMREEARALEAEAKSLAQALGAAETSGAARQASPGDKLQQFYGYFPPVTAAPALLARIFDAARARRLALKSGEYKLVRERDFKLARYQVLLPLSGRYGDVRDFVNAVLEALPAAVLDDFALQRENVGASTVEARVRLTLYLREGP